LSIQNKRFIVRLHFTTIKKYLSDWRNQPLSAVLLLIIVAFIGYKAATISFTWDEAASYLFYVQFNTWLPNQGSLLDANNHLLNSFFMILENTYLPKSIFFLRVHSLFAFLIYAGAAFSISKGLVKNGNVFIPFCIFILHPYLIDFFSLARGYALGLSFELLALAGLLSFINNANKYFPTIIALVLCLATLGNFSMLNFQLAALGVTTLFCLLLFFQKKWTLSKLLKALIPGWIVSGIFFYWILPVLFSLKENGNLYFGGSNGFWKDTVTSLIHNLSYNAIWDEPLEILLKIITISTFMIVPFWLIAKKKLMHEDSWKKLFAVYILLSLMISSTIVQHYYLGTLYLIERTALLFLPVFLSLLVILLTNTKTIFFQKLLTGLLCIHFIFSASKASVLEWKMNANNDKAIELINKLPIPEGRSQINLSASFDYALVLKFYAVYNDIKTIAPLHSRLNYFDLGCDYFMYSEKEKQQIKFPTGKEIYKDHLSGYTIAEKSHPYKQKVVHNHLMLLNNEVQAYDSIKIKDDKGWAMHSENMYSLGFKIILDSLNLKNNAFIEMDVLLRISKPLNKEIELLYSVYRGPQDLVYKNIEIYALLNKNINKWVHIKYSFPLPFPLQEGDIINSYILNNKQQEIEYKQFHLNLFHYKFPN
jgi:hypothetical protein